MHLMGLMTAEQSAHADPDHLLALLTLFRLSGINSLYLHLFTDGRDSYQFLAISLLEKLSRALVNGEKIATVAGRFYAMDRIKEWTRTEMVYNTLVLGSGYVAASAAEAVLQAYNRHENDEYLKPTVIKTDGKRSSRISSNDSVIFFNLRSDRVRELTKAFVQTDFQGFVRKKVLTNLCFVSLTDFGPDLPGVLSAYPSRVLKNTLPFALRGLRQLYIAESEKYAHVTYFFNGGYDHPVVGETRLIIKSPQAYSYNEKPAMSAYELTSTVAAALKNSQYDFIVVNFANPDMVAHTGDLKASIRAVGVVDECLGNLKKAISEVNGTMIITADHGNIEELRDIKTGQVNTSHSSNPVPLIIFSKNIPKTMKLKRGVLSDVAPTILHMMNIPKPPEMGNKILCPYQINQ
jgi:2,3-bisphosphoglycerate-independent phosphoglycerate mutase